MFSSIIKPSAKYGIYLGLFMCAFTVFMWLTLLDTTYYHIGRNLEVVVSIVPVGVILYVNYKLNQDQKLTVSKRLVAGVTVGLVSIAVSSPFTEIYHHFINPEWFDAVLNLQEQKMLSAGASESEFATRLEQMRTGNTTVKSVTSAIISGGVLFPVIVLLASLIFIKSNKESSDES